MKVLIIEDEHYAAKRLQQLLTEHFTDMEVLDIIDTVEDSISWFQNHEQPDIAFLDIQLADGLSFDIFNEVEVTCPIIFITAFDEYALEAFKVNSIDYLLKPIEEAELDRAVNKLKRLKGVEHPQFDWQRIASNFQMDMPSFRQRFLIKNGKSYGYLAVDDLQLAYSEDGISFMLDKAGRRHIIDKTLDQIFQELNHAQFFRVSRKHIVNIKAIEKMHSFSNTRLKLELITKNDQDIIVSREKVRSFKDWIDQ